MLAALCDRALLVKDLAERRIDLRAAARTHPLLHQRIPEQLGIAKSLAVLQLGGAGGTRCPCNPY